MVADGRPCAMNGPAAAYGTGYCPARHHDGGDGLSFTLSAAVPAGR